MSNLTLETLTVVCQTLRQQQEMILELSCATRALVKALEESDDDVALRYERYSQVARHAPDLQKTCLAIEFLEKAIRGFEMSGSGMGLKILEAASQSS